MYYPWKLVWFQQKSLGSYQDERDQIREWAIFRSKLRGEKMTSEKDVAKVINEEVPICSDTFQTFFITFAQLLAENFVRQR